VLFRSPATRAATGTSGASSGPVTFTDPANLLKLQYPGSWTQQDLNSNDNGNVLNIASPESAASFYLSTYSPPFGTIDAEIQDLRANDAKNSKFTITDGPVRDAKIAGEPAKTYTFTYVRKDNPSATTFTGQVWEVNHNGREFYLNASPIGTRKAEVDSIVAAITFTTGAAAPGQLATWTDPNGNLKLQYPSSWSATTDSTDTNNILRLQSPDGSYFYIDLYDPQTGTIDKEIQDFRDVRTKSQKFTDTLGPVADTKIGGEPAKTYPFTYLSKSNPSGPSSNARDYEVNHAGKEYAISVAPIGSHAAEMDAIIASINFLK